MSLYSTTQLEPIIAELQLLLASLIKDDEFEWELADERAERAWETTLEEGIAGSETEPPLVLPDFSLRLAPSAYLHVQYTTPTTTICNIHAPSWARSDHDRLDAQLNSRRSEILENGDDYPTFNLFTSLREYLAWNPLPEPTPRTNGRLVSVAANHGDPQEMRMKCTLMWSHHLLATGKRKNIVQWSTELGLWGISKPGYPGVIVIEGLESDADEFVHRIKQLNWKALQVRCESLGDTLPDPPSDVAPPQRHEWALSHHAKLAKVLQGDIRVREVEGMNEVAELMRNAGLEDVFKSALKL